ncbi:flagellar brake protein [Desulforegula conservatrix]|uniref:flagellar brake protein n=1 Tax=Desulforegula conservatrix TaxID=153026 RepID=UPI0003FE3028|nr:flagellar brake protein [Desulforegula conservatrix]
MKANESETVPFNIELGCQLFLQTQAINERVPTFLIGIIPQSGLIIKTPYVQGVENVVLTGDEIVIRYVFMGEVFGFKSKILTSIAFPFKLTFTTYPEKIEKMSLRKKSRILCNIPTSLHFSSFEMKGVVVDMSSDGVLFSAKMPDDSSPMPLKINTAIILMMPLMGIEGRTKIEGIIKNIRQNDKGLQLGIAFNGLSEDLIQKLDKYVQTIMDHS